MSTHYSTNHIISRPWEALVVFLISFFLLAVFLVLIDFIPEPVAVKKSDAGVAVTSQRFVTVGEITQQNARVSNVNLIAGPTPAVSKIPVGRAPARMVVTSVGIDTAIRNPTATALPVLDAELLKGAVYYPGTASLGEEGSMLLFGHQTYLPAIQNKAFKTFNDLQKVSQGDLISVYADNGTEYRYAVRSVTLVNVDIGSIALETVGHTLTLVTCNSLGAKEERYIVKADFIGTFN